MIYKFTAEHAIIIIFWQAIVAPLQTGTIGNMGPSRGQRRAGAPMEINPRPFLFFLQKKTLQQTKIIRRNNKNTTLASTVVQRRGVDPP